MMLSCLTGCASLRGVQFSDPLSPEEHLNLGVAYEHDGKPDLALREYIRAQTGSTKSMALTYQGNIHASTNNIPEAERKYRAALKVNPENPMALNNLAWLLAQEGRSLDEAEMFIRRALEQDPEPLEAYIDTLNAVLEAKLPGGN